MPGAVWATMLLVAGFCATLACASERGRGLRPRFMGPAVAGRPGTCPERAVDPFGDGTPAPDDARCSYRNPSGSVIELRGRVLTAPDGATPGDPVDGAAVVISAVDPDTGARREVARTHADAQGSFVIGAMMRPGRYVAALAGAPATARAFEVGEGGAPDSVVLIVPRTVAPSP